MKWSIKRERNVVPFFLGLEPVPAGSFLQDAETCAAAIVAKMADEYVDFWMDVRNEMAVTAGFDLHNEVLKSIEFRSESLLKQSEHPDADVMLETLVDLVDDYRESKAKELGLSASIGIRSKRLAGESGRSSVEIAHDREMLEADREQFDEIIGDDSEDDDVLACGGEVNDALRKIEDFMQTVVDHACHYVEKLNTKGE